MSQAVRDLLWVINTPSFVHGDEVAAPAELRAEQVDERALEEFLAAQGDVHRVGRYFEQLVHFWLREVCEMNMLGVGVQVRDGKRTIGELDFVYRDHDDEVVHCEAAVKFFLHCPRVAASDFPGPNASDDFERKTTKLFDQQLRLSEKYYPSVTRRAAFVKGIAFYRSGGPDTLPARMNPAHATGAWCYARAIDELLDRNGLLATIVAKPHWLAPVHLAPLGDMPSLVRELREHFSTGRAHPLMVSLRDQMTSEEVERMFVVADHWPGRSQ